jgi:flagellar L-ring protein precursor FlgH
VIHRKESSPVKTTFPLLAVLGVAAAAIGQESSIFRDPPAPAFGGEVQLPEASMIYHQLPPPRKIGKHDLITIRVDKKAVMSSEGEVQRRKTGLYDAVLADWIALKGLLEIKPAPQTEGDPRAKGQVSEQYRAQADMETREALAFDITAEVVDIRPNGLLVLEAHDTLQNNEEVWEYSLSGICRPEDIDPGNVILSKHIAQIRVWKREHGQIRDSYRRGWFVRWFDRFNPF